MTKIETVDLLDILKQSYPKFFISNNTSDMQKQINVWYLCLKEYDFNIIQAATISLIKTLKFPPTIADITESIYKLTHKDELTEQEAWNIIRKAISNSYTVRESFEAMPTLVKRIVGSASQLGSWALMDLNTVNSVVSSNFQRSYKALAASQKEIIKINPMLTGSNTKLLGGD